MRTMPTPPSPAGVATAAIVSSLYIKRRLHLSNSDFEGNINHRCEGGTMGKFRRGQSASTRRLNKTAILNFNFFQGSHMRGTALSRVARLGSFLGEMIDGLWP